MFENLARFARLAMFENLARFVKVARFDRVARSIIVTKNDRFIKVKIMIVLQRMIGLSGLSNIPGFSGLQTNYQVFLVFLY